MSRVDVIVPCYNYGHYLRGCVQSALSQERVDVRVLIIDDCSQDNTKEVGHALAVEQARVEYRRHTVNRGHIETYNEGIDWACGDYMLLLSADDFLFPGSLFRAANLMDRYPNVGLTHGRVTRVDGHEACPSVGETECTWRIMTGWDYIRSICQTGENVVATPTAVVRMSVQHKVGGYRRELPHAGDMEMWLRFAAVSSIASTDVYQACYRRHAQNMSQEYYKAFGDLQQRREVFRLFFKDHDAQIPDAALLSTNAFRRLSLAALVKAHDSFETADLDRSRDWEQLAFDIDASVKSTREWKRLRIKRLIGSRVWKRARPLLDLVRSDFTSTRKR